MWGNVGFHSPFVSSLFKALIAASRPGFTKVCKTGEISLRPLNVTISALVAPLLPKLVRAVVRRSWKVSGRSMSAHLRTLRKAFPKLSLPVYGWPVTLVVAGARCRCAGGMRLLDCGSGYNIWQTNCPAVTLVMSRPLGLCRDLGFPLPPMNLSAA